MTTLLKDEIEKLIDNLIQENQTNSKKLGKVYEFSVLTDILDKKHSNGYQISCKPNDPTTLKFGGSPCKPDKKKYDFIKIVKANQTYEIWVSAEFLTFSHHLTSYKDVNLSSQYGGKHELDIGIFKPFQTEYPIYADIVEGYFCKYNDTSKAFIREIIGLKVEMGWELFSNKLYFYSNQEYYDNFAPNLGIYNIYVKLFK